MTTFTDSLFFRLFRRLVRVTFQGYASVFSSQLLRTIIGPTYLEDFFESYVTEVFRSAAHLETFVHLIWGTWGRERAWARQRTPPRSPPAARPPPRAATPPAPAQPLLPPGTFCARTARSGRWTGTARSPFGARPRAPKWRRSCSSPRSKAALRGAMSPSPRPRSRRWTPSCGRARVRRRGRRLGLSWWWGAGAERGSKGGSEGMGGRVRALLALVRPRLQTPLHSAAGVRFCILRPTAYYKDMASAASCVSIWAERGRAG